MMTDAERQFFRENKFTLKGRILHPALVKPAFNKEGTRENYNVQFIWKPEENKEVHAKIGQFLQHVYQTMYSTVPMEFWVNPVKKFDTYKRQDGKPNPEILRGHCWVNAASGKEVPPAVVKQGPMNTFITLGPNDEAEVYSGRNAVIQISFYKIPKNKQGLSTNIEAVLLLEGGDRIASGGVDVNKVFQSFAQDMAAFGGNANPFTQGNANAGTNPFGQTNPGSQTQGSQQVSAGQNAQNTASPSNNPFANNGGGFV